MPRQQVFLLAQDPSLCIVPAWLATECVKDWHVVAARTFSGLAGRLGTVLLHIMVLVCSVWLCLELCVALHGFAQAPNRFCLQRIFGASFKHVLVFQPCLANVVSWFPGHVVLHVEAFPRVLQILLRIR